MVFYCSAWNYIPLRSRFAFRGAPWLSIVTVYPCGKQILEQLSPALFGMQVVPFHSKDDLVTVIHVLVIKLNCYFNTLYLGLPLESLQQHHWCKIRQPVLLIRVYWYKHIFFTDSNLFPDTELFICGFKPLKLVPTSNAPHGLGYGYTKYDLISSKPVTQMRLTSEVV